MASAQKTQDHETIKKWVEERGGRPAVVKETQNSGRGAGVLRVKFDPNEEDLQEVDWNDFFDTFDENDLRFLYQAESGGQDSRFFKFVRD